MLVLYLLFFIENKNSYILSFSIILLDTVYTGRQKPTELVQEYVEYRNFV